MTGPTRLDKLGFCIIVFDFFEWFKNNETKQYKWTNKKTARGEGGTNKT